MARRQRTVKFDDDGESFAEGDVSLEDVDFEAVTELQRKLDDINSIEDDAERKVAMRALLAEMYPDGETD